MKKRQQRVQLLLKVLLVISTLSSGCKTKYASKELFFVKPFHDNDTLVFQNLTNRLQTDTFYFRKEVVKQTWLPGFRDGVKFSDRIYIHCEVNSEISGKYDNVCILVSRAESGIFTVIDFNGLSARFDSCKYCCLKDTAIKVNSKKEYSSPIYCIKDGYGINYGVDYVSAADVKSIWWKEEIGMIMYEKKDGSKWVRIN